tara:strand:+ start:1669 stop:2349 length:681 start_codon:yes stop_codon:yes gene_type:complete
MAVFGCLLVSILTTTAMSAQEVTKPESLADRVSYSYGLMIARQLTERGIKIDLDQFSAAFKTVLDGGEPLLGEDEVSAAFSENQTLLDEKNAEGADQENLIAGKQFLAENLKKDGIESTSSGLQYEVLTEGSGEKPAPTDTVEVHYHGTLIDGTVFDSSVDRGSPTSFPLNRVIPGWTEGLQLMNEGSKYRFYIPYALAYAERGAGGDIKPYSALVFEVELLKVGE